MEGGGPSLTLVLALAAGVVGQSVARHVRIPGIVILLALGWALGPDGIGWVQPRTLGDGLFAIVELAVAIILFEGGLNLEGSRLARSQTPIRRLVTWGPFGRRPEPAHHACPREPLSDRPPRKKRHQPAAAG